MVFKIGVGFVPIQACAESSLHNLFSSLSFSTILTAGPKGNEDQKRFAVHYTTSEHYQENVFIEGSRPQYLEDLHTEAQEGLKIQQQEGQAYHFKYESILVPSADTYWHVFVFIAQKL